MDHSLSLTLTETIQAPVSEVWNALTDKETIKQYFFGTEAESDWQTGSPITFTGTWEGRQYRDKGTIQKIEKEKLLSFTYWSSMSGLEDTPENHATVTYRLQPVGNGTRLTVTQKGFRDKEAYEHSGRGWKEVLQNLKQAVEDSIR